MKRILIATAFIIATAFTIAAFNWKVVPDSKVNFKINGPLGADVKGTFTISNSDIEFNPANLEKASINATVKVATINTGNEKRDKHLKSDDFFDAEKYPNISFKSSSVEKDGDGKFIAKGNLTIKETTKPISIPFTFEQKEDEGTFNGEFKINRVDYGVGGKSMMMGKEVVIILNIAVKK